MSCPSGKIPFSSQTLAERNMRLLIRRNRTPRKRVKQLHTYRCPSCGSWHVGHSRPRRNVA